MAIGAGMGTGMGVGTGMGTGMGLGKGRMPCFCTEGGDGDEGVCR